MSAMLNRVREVGYIAGLPYRIIRDRIRVQRIVAANYRASVSALHDTLTEKGMSYDELTSGGTRSSAS